MSKETKVMIAITVLWVPALFTLAKVLDFLERANWL